MKKSERVRGLLAGAAVAGGLVFALAPAQARAAQVSGSSFQNQVGITKDWTVASEAQYDAEQAFGFTLTYVGAEGGGYSGTPTLYQTSDYTAPVADGTVVNDDVSVSGLAAKDGQANTYEATVALKDVFDGLDFWTPGIYHFTLAENATDNPNVAVDDTVYDVYVNVEWAPYSTISTTFDSFVFQRQGSTEKSEGAVFANTPAQHNDLTVWKTVAGGAANTDDEFSYRLELTGVRGSYSYEKSGTGIQGTETGVIASGGTFTLKSGQKIVVKDLPYGATYTVTETDAKGYDSVDVADEDRTTPATVTNPSADNLPTGKGVVSRGYEQVHFTNNKGFAPKTGITMNGLVGATLLVAAGAGLTAVVVRRRAKAGEDF